MMSLLEYIMKSWEKNKMNKCLFAFVLCLLGLVLFAEPACAALSADTEVIVRLKKARVLGWDKRYEDSISEYKKILEKNEVETVRFEMEAKEAYWNKKTNKAIKFYNRLLQSEPLNLEARFDLSQIYCHQSIWDLAYKENKEILAQSKEHFRAQEALTKINLITKHVSCFAGYKFFQAESDDRNTDIDENLFFSTFKIPLTYKLFLDIGYKHTLRKFSDWQDLQENEIGVKLLYFQRPSLSFFVFYNFLQYNRDIKSIGLYGGEVNLRVFDLGEISLKYAKENLVNSSNVIRKRYYADNFSTQFFTDINSKVRVGLDYLYSSISDNNIQNGSEIYTIYYFSLEPKRFSLEYRFKYQSYKNTVEEYFSPNNLKTHIVSWNWRHFLNKEAIFFGGDDLYYDFIYDIAFDSENVFSYALNLELNKDINKKLNINLRCGATFSDANIYKEKHIQLSFKFYF